MKKFVFVYHGKIPFEDIIKAKPEKNHSLWTTWFATFKEKIVDGGNAFTSNPKVVTKAEVKSTSADKWPARGYTIINTGSMEEATKIAKGCPVFINNSEGAVYVYEVIPN